jgi:hypothetical protein
MSDGLLPRGIKLTHVFLHMHQEQHKSQLAFFWTHVSLSQDISQLMNPSIDPFQRLPIGSRAR